MMTVDRTQNVTADRLAWVEPSVMTLDVADTANQFGKGFDKNTATDCTKS